MPGKRDAQDCPWVIMGPPPAVGSCIRCLTALAPPKVSISPRLYAQRLRRFVLAHTECGKLPDQSTGLPEGLTKSAKAAVPFESERDR